MSDITKSEVAFVDSAIPDLKGFLSAIRPEVDAIVIDRATPCLAQIAAALQDCAGLAAVHVVAHGRSGEINLGSDSLSLDTVIACAVELKAIGQAIKGELLLWSCEAGGGDRGATFVDALARAAGVSVSAATGQVGAKDLGGQWLLDVCSGRPAAAPAPLTSEGLATWSGVLKWGVSWNPSNSKEAIEGSTIALGTIAPTGGTAKSLVISGIPVGAVLSDGQGDSFTATPRYTSVDVTAWNLSQLTITPANDVNFVLTVTAIHASGATATATENVIVDPLAPTVTATPTAGVEGAAIALNLAATVNGSPGDSDVISGLVISNIPVGAVLSDGNGHSFTANAGHTAVDVLGWSLANLTITPMTDTNFTLSVTATEKDAEGNLSAPVSTTEAVTVNPLAAAVSWSPSAEFGVEGSPIALGTISATVNGLSGDSNSLVSLVVSAIPVGATLSDGNGHSFTASAGHTAIDVLGWSLANLTITPATDANFALSVTATEKDAEGNLSAPVSATEVVTVNPLAAAVGWSPSAQSGVEGSPIALGTISATVNGLAGDSNSLASLVVSAIPVNATLSDGNGHSFTASAGHTAIDVTSWSLASLTITPATDSDFTLTVTATEKDAEGNLSAPVSTTEAVTVNPLAAAVSWSPSAEFGVEGSPIALGTISATVNGLSGDSNSLVSLIVSSIPVNATLSDGNGHSFTASAGQTSIDVLGWSLATLTITTTTDTNFTLSVTATEKDAEGNLSTPVSTTEVVMVNPLAAAVSWSPSAETGVEGSPIALGMISATVNGLAGDNNSLASLVVSAIPVNATLSDGNGHSFTASAGHTDVDVAGWSLANLTITPATDTNFTLSVTATEKDADGNLSAPVSTTEAVTVNPLAAAVSWSPSTGVGVEGSPIALGTISATVNGLAGDNNSLASLVVSAIPVDATLSDGNGHSFTASAEHTDVDVAGWSLANLTITPATDTNFTLSVTATEKDAEGNLSAPVSTTEAVTVNPLAAAVSWSPSAETGVEGSPIALGTISATVNGLAGDSNSLASLVVSAIPANATLSDGNGNSFTASAGHTDVDVAGWSLANLTITPATDTNFTLSVTATEKDADGNLSAPVSTTEAVTVNPPAADVSWSPSAETGVEGSPIALGTISATVNGLAGDNNSLASLVVSAIPVDATLSDGNGHSFTASAGHTDVDVAGWSLANLTITPATDTNFTLSVTATEKDADGNLSAPVSTTEAVTVNPPAADVSWSPSAATGSEGSPIALGTISATVNGLAGDNNSLASLVVSAIPVDATLSDGNGHSFTASAGHTDVDVAGWSLANLTITPATDANFTLTVTATEKDAEGNLSAPLSTTEAVTVNPLAAAVSWSPSAETGVEGSPIALGTISATVNGLAGDSNSLASLVVSAIPANATLSDGNGNSFTASAGHTDVDVAGWSLANLTITPATDTNFTLSVTATEKDAEGNLSAPVSTTEAVTVNPPAADVSWSPSAATGSEGSPIALGTISATANGLAGDTNSLASLVVSAIPEGAILSDGDGHAFMGSAGHTSTDVLGWSLANLTITPTTEDNFTLTVTATEQDADGNLSAPVSATEAVTVNPYVSLDVPGEWFLYAQAINNSGQVAGYFEDNSGTHGFIYNTGTYTTLDDPAAAQGTVAAGINGSGDVAGYYYDDNGFQHGFVYSAETYTALDDPQATQGTSVQGINASGEVVGNYFDDGGQHGFIYNGSTYTTLDDPSATQGTFAQALNDSGEAGGYYTDDNGDHGFIYNAGAYTTLDDPQATQGTYVQAINASGEVVGNYFDGAGEHGFIYNASTYTTLDDPLATHGTTVQGINGSGEIIGNYFDDTGQHGFIYDAGAYTTVDEPSATAGTVVTAVNDAGKLAGGYYTASADSFINASGNFTNLQDPVATTQTVGQAINDSGQVVGNEIDNTGQHGFLYSSGAYTTLDDPNAGGTTAAVGINDSGEVAGYYYDSKDVLNGFVYNAGTYTTVDDTLGTQGTIVQGINAGGELVGNYYDNAGQHGFIDNAGTYTTIDPNALGTTNAVAINAGGEVAGYYNDNAGTHGFIYSAGTYTTLDDPSATGGTYVQGINDTGEVIGYYNDSSGQHAFMYNADTYMTLDDPLASGGTTYAAGINNSGQIVGYYTDATGQHGFVYSNGTYATIDDPSSAQEVTGISAINNLGEVVGFYQPVSTHGFLTV